MKLKQKRGIVISTLIWWIIGIAFLALIIVFSILLKDKLSGIIDYIQEIFRS